MKNIHFIGVGGISMSAIAEILLSEGCSVSGSDRNENHLTRFLEEKGMKFYLGHSPENISPDTDLVVYTVAVSYDNPELVEARSRGIKVVPRSKILGDIMAKYQYPLAVAGTHGKTTTTSMLSYIFTYMDLDPTIIVGGGLDLLNKKTLRLGGNKYFIAEACEYYRSFLDFKPFVATILNVEPDHLDYYKDETDFQSAFIDFSKNVLPGGFLIACCDDKDMHKITAETSATVITYGLEKNADITATDISFTCGMPSYTLKIYGQKICRVNLSVLGKHNVLNSLAALANAYVLGLDMVKAAEYIGLFKGAVRRFEYMFKVNGADIYDDYAHHPTEVAATVEAAANLPHRKLYIVFQPHTYSRTKIFLDRFSSAFTGADEVIIADIYAAREPYDSTIPTSLVAEKISKNGTPAKAISGNENISRYLKENLKENDIAVIMGAGDVFKIYDLLK